MASSDRVIGVDESGKGDFFGPLVVASFLCDGDDLPRLAALGVRDGKTLSLKRILEIDHQLRFEFEHEVVVWMPEDYNNRYQKIKNLNVFLAEGHAEAIALLAARANGSRAISDKFGKTELIENALKEKGCKITLMQIVRGEAIPQVAAASIIARARFVKEVETLSLKYGMELPRGAASHVDEAGREMVQRYGIEELSKVGKVHFKNYQKIVNPRLHLRQ